MDGYSSTNAGGTVSSDFTQASSLTNPVYQTVMVAGNLRYEVQYIVPADNGYSEMEMYYYYVWSGAAVAESSIKLLP